ncbi:phage portal protein [Mesobacillus zeae]|uniref:Phage portal protein n=1 Tax=Mesobacillus zeae TaxID=1917180 RepID=A0A398B6C9_9BACI|nr:phage portal protein [Mesobacillus zeae]RID85659.1 phage portal protein [Mesobacillus zeae]
MYPNTPTETEKLAAQMQKDSATAHQRLIKEYIDNHDTSKMAEGVRYYENENDITKRVQYAVVDDVKIVDNEKTNNKIPHGWHKLLVDQKAAYLVGQPINFSADDEKLTEFINEYLGEKWDDTANELVVAASNKGKEWLHPFIDEDGEFDFMQIPAEQCIPVYADKRNRKLAYMIRYYPHVLVDEETIRVELSDDKQVWFYVKSNGEYIPDPSVEENPQSHFYYGAGKNMKGYGWGRVPFIKFRNNEQEKGDLAYYKQSIDSFDKRVSDNQNTLDEIQELITILKGYDGTDLGEFQRNLRYYKTIKVDSEGGVDTLKQEMPIASIDSHLDRLRESIFTFGFGVDVGTDKFGNSPSGIALEFLYSLLDLKASTLERKFRPALQELMWFLCEYLSISGKGEFDYKEVDFTFKRTMMVNELEIADIAQKSAGIISKKTILANHPWVDDLQQEMKRIEEEKEAYVDLETPIKQNKVNNNEPGKQS